MIDVVFFREMNSNYTRSKMNDNSSVISYMNFFDCSNTLIKNTKKVRCIDLESNELELADLFCCCLIVLGFSFTNKL